MWTSLCPSQFNMVPIGGQFVEVFSPCNEIATKIEPIIYKRRLVNAQRSGGVYIIMWYWEPVLIECPEETHGDGEANRVGLWRQSAR